MKRAKSILQNEKCCFVCKTTLGLAPHETMFGSSDRKKSFEWGCWLWLCSNHHTATSQAVHNNPKLDKELKIYTQKKFEELYGHDKWMQIYKKNFI